MAELGDQEAGFFDGESIEYDHYNTSSESDSETPEKSNTAPEKSVQKGEDKNANTEKEDSSNKRDDSKDGDPSSSNPRKSSSKNGGKRSYSTCALSPSVIYPSLPKMLSFYNNTKKISAVKYKKLSTIQYVSPACNKGVNSL